MLPVSEEARMCRKSIGFSTFPCFRHPLGALGPVPRGQGELLYLVPPALVSAVLCLFQWRQRIVFILNFALSYKKKTTSVQRVIHQ